MNDKRNNLQYICYKMYGKKCNVYLVHTHVVQGCHPHWSQLVAIVSQAQLSIAIIAPAIHLQEKERGQVVETANGKRSPVLHRSDTPNLRCGLQGPTNAWCSHSMTSQMKNWGSLMISKHLPHVLHNERHKEGIFSPSLPKARNMCTLGEQVVRATTEINILQE